MPEGVGCREWLALVGLWRREIELARPFSTQMVQSMPRVVPEEQSLEPPMRVIGRPCVHGLAVRTWSCLRCFPTQDPAVAYMALFFRRGKARASI